MAVIYIAGTEDVAKLVNVHFDQEDSWWGGVFSNAASVALASALAVTALATTLSATVTASHQDELGSTVAALTVDEQYWQNQVPPASASVWQPLPLGVDTEFAAVAAFVPDEDLWINPVSAVPATFGPLYLPDPRDIPAGSLVDLQVDEQYWQNAVAPVSASLGRLYLPDPEEISSGSLHGQPEEDLWINLVSPVQAVNSWPQPWTFDVPESVAAAPLVHPDEDYWLNPAAAVPSAFWQLPTFGFDFDVPALHSIPLQVLAALNARGVPQLVMFSQGVLVVGRTLPQLADTSGRVVPNLISLGGRVIY